jgi:hypothetical protein
MGANKQIYIENIHSTKDIIGTLHHQLPRMCRFLLLAIDNIIPSTLGFHPICLHHRYVCMLIPCSTIVKHIAVSMVATTTIQH